jgi:hypothetical protein
VAESQQLNIESEVVGVVLQEYYTFWDMAMVTG